MWLLHGVIGATKAALLMSMLIPGMVTCQPCVYVPMDKDMLSAREAVLQDIQFQHAKWSHMLRPVSKAYTMSCFALTTNYQNTLLEHSGLP